jgi:hypothetical protein
MTRQMDKPDQPPPSVWADAKHTPGGWLYVFDEEFGVGADVPPEAIRGAWKIDDNGNITDEFTPNPLWRGNW